MWTASWKTAWWWDVTTTVEPTDHVIKTYGAGAPVSPLTGPDGTTNAPASYSQVLTGKATGYYSRTGKGSSGLGPGLRHRCR